ncbi:heme-binding domain-containing protein [Sulfurovum sp. NBC37-1]|uniref:heme-binding domain-containing protein n=1 Tax=Sulfurovum sp. (strain NBC37-1) TaxID=387093 RepID=UPI0001587643|nr:heme-binding domain-containing protein [Sulfurovum sp. NBC37-1]BAF71870.1 cytochrome c [Sulfurovum sp. NBC37-1]
MKKLLILLILVFVGIQFVPMNVPADLPVKEGDALEAPENVQAILKRSCFDCHSSHTTFPWYSSIAPVSWFTKKHVKKGREKMNFSTWNSYDDEKKLKYLEKIPKAIQDKMPMKSYLIMHKEAKLSDAEKEALKAWTTEAAFDLE